MATTTHAVQFEQVIEALEEATYLMHGLAEDNPEERDYYIRRGGEFGDLAIQLRRFTREED